MLRSSIFPHVLTATSASSSPSPSPAVFSDDVSVERGSALSSRRGGTLLIFELSARFGSALWRPICTLHARVRACVLASSIERWMEGQVRRCTSEAGEAEAEGSSGQGGAEFRNGIDEGLHSILLFLTRRNLRATFCTEGGRGRELQECLSTRHGVGLHAHLGAPHLLAGYCRLWN